MRMNKQTKRIIMTIALILLLVSIGSAAVVLGQPTLETRATRFVEVAEEASEKVGDIIVLIDTNETLQDKIDDAGLTDAFEGNVTLYWEGLGKVDDAGDFLAFDDYKSAIANATEALRIFREVYRSINNILCESDVKLGQFVDVEELEEAVERSQERVDELKELISADSPIYYKLIDAEGILTQALEFLPDKLEEAKASLREANILISEVCQYLKEVAQELNPQRIRDYCDSAYQYMERFRERFGQAGAEGFDVDGFLRGFGYQNEDDFMARFQEMIQNAEGTEDVKDVLDDLEEIGRLIREMDQNLTQEMGRYRAQYGRSESGNGLGQESGGSSYSQEGSGSGYGQEFGGSEFVQSGGGYVGQGSSGQMGFGGGQ
jgi:prefoldin subunit 5